MLNTLSGLTSVSPIFSPLREGDPALQSASGGLLQSPELDPNREKQFFYNKDLNKLFNMEMGVRRAAPKGFESVNKDQYEDYANKGATEQGKYFFNDAMGGGYNLDLPRLTSGPNSGGVDRNSPEYLYYHGDDQKTKLGLGNLSGIGGLLSIAPGENANNMQLPGLIAPQQPKKYKYIGPPEQAQEIQQPLTQEIQQPGIGGLLGSGNENSFTTQPTLMPGNIMPENTMGGINSLSEFGKPPSLGGSPLMGGINNFQPNQQPFKDNQGLNSYIDNMVNGRLKDIFGGIMGSFK